MLFLVGCGGAASERDDTTAPTGADPGARRGMRVACSHGGAPVADTCSVERSMTARGIVMTLRHPDGGFHRLLVRRNGTIAAADGAGYALATQPVAGGMAVTIGTDRYRLPDTLIGPAS